MHFRMPALLSAMILLTASILAATAWRGFAADDPPHTADAAKRALPVAVIDVARLFQGHRVFVQQLAKLKMESTEAGKQLAVRGSEIQTVQNQLKNPQTAEADRGNLQVLLARLQAEYKVFAQKQKGDLLKRESLLYLSTYREISRVIEEYAKQNNIQLVMRVNKKSPDAEKRESILAWINRDIVYEQGLDITDRILRIVNAQPDA